MRATPLRQLRQRTPMPDDLDDARYQLALANRIVAHEGVLDGFGHVSIRHPSDPGRYLLARSRSPELIEPSDILEFSLDSKLLTPTSELPYGECVIHGCIYQSRPDVHAVCHHHSMAILPFCVTGVALRPLVGLGATMGGTVPFWDSRDEFGDTPMVVTTPEQGRSLARALGPNAMVLMRRLALLSSAPPCRRRCSGRSFPTATPSCSGARRLWARSNL